MKEVLTASQISTIRPAFTIKINQLMINLSSVQEVSEALQAALDQYQEGKQFVAQLGPDQTRELNVLTVEAKSAEEKKEEEKEEQETVGSRLYKGTCRYGKRYTGCKGTDL